MTAGQGLVGGQRRYGICWDCGGRYSWSHGGYYHTKDCPRVQEQRQRREADTLRDLRAPVIVGCPVHEEWVGDPLDCVACIEIGDRDDG